MSRLPSISEPRQQSRPFASQPPPPPAGGSGSREIDARGCAAYIAMLKTVLDSATGDPPPGVDVGEVEHRLVLLQGALDEVREKSLDLAKKRELEEQQRYLKSVQRLLAQERELQERQAKDNQAKALAVAQAREDAIFYFKDKNEKSEERALRCRDHTRKAQEDIVVRASSNEVRWQKNLDNLYAERERKRLEAVAKGEKRQQYARNVMQNREQQLEAKRFEMEEKARLHDQEVEAKMEMIRNSRKSKWEDKGNRNRSKSIVVFENGEAILETQAKDHEQLVKDLEEKMKGQRERFAGEKAERDFFLQQRQANRKDKEQQISRNLMRLADARLARGGEIIKDSEMKRQKADHAKQAVAHKYRVAAVSLQKDLDEHQRRAAQLQTDRQNAALSKAFKRWNQRAARIITDLRADFDDKKKSIQEESDPWQNNTGRPQPPTPEKRAIRLPSPSDFSC